MALFESNQARVAFSARLTVRLFFLFIERVYMLEIECKCGLDGVKVCVEVKFISNPNMHKRQTSIIFHCIPFYYNFCMYILRLFK